MVYVGIKGHRKLQSIVGNNMYLLNPWIACYLVRLQQGKYLATQKSSLEWRGAFFGLNDAETEKGKRPCLVYYHDAGVINQWRVGILWTHPAFSTPALGNTHPQEPAASLPVV